MIKLSAHANTDPMMMPVSREILRAELKRFLHRSNHQLCHAVSSARVTKLRLP